MKWKQDLKKNLQSSNKEDREENKEDKEGSEEKSGKSQKKVEERTLSSASC